MDKQVMKMMMLPECLCLFHVGPFLQPHNGPERWVPLIFSVTQQESESEVNHEPLWGSLLSMVGLRAVSPSALLWSPLSRPMLSLASPGT